MTTDQQIYQRLGQILLDQALETTEAIFLRASLNNIGDVGKFIYEAKTINGSLSSFSPRPGTNTEVLELLVQLRSFFVAQGHPAWRVCLFSINLIGGQFSIDFKYD